MKDLRNRVAKLGLVVNENETARIADYNAFIADYIYKDVYIIARYIFVYASYDNFENYMQEHSLFTKDVIEATFYNLRNDLRWNLYLVCVMSTEDFNKLPENEIIKFKTNKDFTRNIVIPADELENEIPAGKMALCSTENENRETLNPLSVWSEKLSEDMQFCLGGYETKLYNSYVNGDSIHIEKRKKRRSGVQIDYINKMTSLMLTQQFRPHCFGALRELHLSKVNILAGANGSGKTSILQAMELVMTGAIRASEKHLSTDGSNSGIYIYHGSLVEKKLKIPKDASERKSRQSMWYNDKSDKDTVQSLNNSFHIFNMFTPEDVFRVSFSKEKEEYSNIFTKMLFGEEAETAQKSWQKYRDEFNRSFKSNQNIIDELHQQLKIITFPHETKKEGILDNIRIIGLKVQSDSAMSQMREVVVDVKQLCNSIASYPSICSLEQIAELRSRKEKSMVENLKNVEIMKLSIQNETLKIETQTLEQEQLFEEKKGLVKEQGALENAQSYAPGFRFIADNYDGLCELNIRKEEWRSKKQAIDSLESFLLEHGHIENFPGVYATYEASLVRHDVISARLKELKTEESGLDIKYEKLMKTKDEVDAVITNIKAYGSMYVDLTNDYNGCPLCGNQNITIDELKAHLKIDAQGTTDLLATTVEKRTQLKNEITNLMNELATYSTNVSHLKEIDIAYASLLESNISYQESSDKLNIVNAHIQYCKKAVQSFELLSNQIKNEETKYENSAPQRVKSMLGNGNYLAYISMIENNLSLAESISESTPSRVLKIMTTVQSRQQELTSRQSANDNQQFKISAFLSDAQKNKEQLKEKLNILKNEESSLKNEINEIDKLEELFYRLKDFLVSDTSVINRSALIRQCSDVELMIDNYLTQENSRIEQSKIVAKVREIEAIQKRLENAISAMSDLRETQKYADDFIKDNIKRISEIFHALHTPQEFSKLDIVDNEVFGFRSKDSVKVALSNMSTGQKTAVALSIFLLLNSSMQTIPSVILIDEPIANIDDLNIVSFIDVVRELAICGNRQIFITTANDNVRKLLRRKFSFMGDELSEFNFKRVNNMKAQITVRKYDDVRELTDRENIVLFDDAY